MTLGSWACWFEDGVSISDLPQEERAPTVGFGVSISSSGKIARPERGFHELETVFLFSRYLLE